ncbi:hypothetical protein FGO68_gene10558 [Halteria grandinella]|uniref:Transmembrane protein n=1 Tax=Halteria grandinella TaxID=5974 RepID=A0A8J8T451_HALGN|nr:hypothetical protein FGO68_gene10558 [Halteria grandinella]
MRDLIKYALFVILLTQEALSVDNESTSKLPIRTIDINNGQIYDSCNLISKDSALLIACINNNGQQDLFMGPTEEYVAAAIANKTLRSISDNRGSDLHYRSWTHLLSAQSQIYSIQNNKSDLMVRFANFTKDGFTFIAKNYTLDIKQVATYEDVVEVFPKNNANFFEFSNFQNTPAAIAYVSLFGLFENGQNQSAQQLFLNVTYADAKLNGSYRSEIYGCQTQDIKYSSYEATTGEIKYQLYFQSEGMSLSELTISNKNGIQTALRRNVSQQQCSLLKYHATKALLFTTCKDRNTSKMTLKIIDKESYKIIMEVPFNELDFTVAEVQTDYLVIAYQSSKELKMMELFKTNQTNYILGDTMTVGNYSAIWKEPISIQAASASILGIATSSKLALVKLCGYGEYSSSQNFKCSPCPCSMISQNPISSQCVSQSDISSLNEITFAKFSKSTCTSTKLVESLPLAAILAGTIIPSVIILVTIIYLLQRRKQQDEDLVVQIGPAADNEEGEEEENKGNTMTKINNQSRTIDQSIEQQDDVSLNSSKRSALKSSLKMKSIH